MIFRWFGALRSFGDKVTWLVTLTSGVAIIAVCFALATVDYASQRRETLANLESQTMIVAMNSSAPLAFGDQFSAGEALAAFRTRNAVALATLYDLNGNAFASYRRQGGVTPTSAKALPGSWLVQRWVTQVRPIEEHGELLGRIEVVYDLEELQERLVRSLVASLVVSLVAVALVYLFSLRINQVLVKPIALLSQTARQVSETKDYTLRAPKVSEDELGLFTDTFNQMLAQIQKQDLEIQASRADALQASRLKDEFLATLSHELRTPMTPILGWAQILQRSAMGNPQVLQAAEVIERNARAQNRIIDDLLEMSRIISGKIRIDVQVLDLERVVLEALDTVATAAEARGIGIDRTFQPGLPATRGDPHRLQQVVWNLLSNAIKFTGTGGRVGISLRRVDKDLELAVTDTGQGIAAEFLPHVFERFRQADSSNTRQYSGLGLGLAIVKQLVELHGGNVRVESAGSGQGSTFYVCLPVASAGAVDPRPHTQASALASPVRMALDPELGGMRLLLVDDEFDARELVAHLLRSRGVQVLAVESAAAALSAMPDFNPDVLVSDIGMPDANGYELIQRVRALAPEEGGSMPAIALTAFARPEDRERALAAGFQLHVSKPVEESELLAAVAKVSDMVVSRG